MKLISATAFFVLVCPVLSQTTVPLVNLTVRVLEVESEIGDRSLRGTIFSIDIDNREYWITAKHILTGAEHPPYGLAPSGKVTLKILNPYGGDNWVSERFTVIEPGTDIDEVVLVTDTELAKAPFHGVKASEGSIILGDDCAFVGYPFGWAWAAEDEGGEIRKNPFVKHCTVSGAIGHPHQIWVLDGINNHGFSGGPVVHGAGDQQTIFAVVSGFQPESVAVLPNHAAAIGSTGGSKPKNRTNHVTRPKSVTMAQSNQSHVDVNSGFFVAYDMKYALQAIYNNPIGPLRQSKPEVPNTNH